jgi:hypothetical protein
MSSTFRAQCQITTADPSQAAYTQAVTVQDAVPTTHDYVDATPLNVATSGITGLVFTKLPMATAQVERLAADIPPGSDLVLRTGGAVASVLGTTAAPSIVGAETLVLAVDGGSQFTTTFVAGDTTIAKVAARINFFAGGSQVASVDTATGFLRLSGLLTGGADAKTAGRQSGSVQVVSGTAAALLGLTVATVYGSGDDQRVGAGPFLKTFPTSGLPRLIEVSGTSNGARFWVAGKASLWPFKTFSTPATSTSSSPPRVTSDSATSWPVRAVFASSVSRPSQSPARPARRASP